MTVMSLTILHNDRYKVAEGKVPALIRATRWKSTETGLEGRTRNTPTVQMTN